MASAEITNIEARNVAKTVVEKIAIAKTQTGSATTSRRQDATKNADRTTDRMTVRSSRNSLGVNQKISPIKECFPSPSFGVSRANRIVFLFAFFINLFF